MRLLTVDEVAQLLKVPKAYIYRMSYENRLPGKIKLGARTLRYDASVIEDWLQSKVEKAAEEECRS